MTDNLPPALHFRFTHGNEIDLARLQHFIVGQFKPLRWLIVLEEADSEVNRDHTHTAIYTHTTKKLFSGAVRKNFPIHKGNSAFTVFDEIKDNYALECYLCKGKAKNTMPKVIDTNLSADEILERHLEYWRKNEEMKTKPKTKKQQPWIKTVAEQFKEQHPNKKIYDDETCRYFVFNFVMDKLAQDTKALDAFILKRLVLGVMNILICPSAKRDFRKSLFRQTFPESYDIGEKYDLLV